MYPEKLEDDRKRTYFSETEYFHGKFNMIHTYLHTDYHYHMHAHQFYEINVIVSGQGKHYIENTVLDTSPGDVFVIPPEVSHGYISEDRLDIFHVLIKTEFLTRYREELAEIDGFELLFDIEPQIRRSSGKNLNLNAGSPMTAAFLEALEQMVQVEADGQYVFLNALTMIFICKLCERLHGAVSASCEREIVAVMEYVQQNLDSKLSLDLLAQLAHMSVPTLNRRFRAVTGQSPMHYVLSCRIAKAKQLIRENHMSRTDVAQACGFYDLTHMNKYL